MFATFAKNIKKLKRKFILNLALVIFLNLLIKPFWIFGIDRTVQNVVGAEQYGFYFSLFSFSMLFNILLDLGITNFNNKNIAQNSHLLSKHLSNVVVIKFLLAIVYTIVSLIAAYFMGYHWQQMNLLFVLIFNQFLISFVLYLRSNLSGLQLFKTDSFISVLDRLLMILICSVLLWGNITDEPFKISWFVYAQTAAYLATMLVTFAAVLMKAKFLKLHFDLKFFIIFLKQSYPFAILILLMSFYNRIDSVLLERMLPDGKEQAGIYAQAFRMLDAANMFAYLFAALLLPMFARMIKLKQDVSQLTKLSYLLLIIPSIILSVSCFIFRHEIMNTMYDSHVEASARIFAVLMFGFVAISTTYIFGTLLTSNGNLKYLNIMASVGMVLNIILNLILIPRYQAYGSAMASLITQAFTALTQVLIAKKVFSFKTDYSSIIRLGFFVTLLFFIGIYVVPYFNQQWLISLVIFGTIGISLSFALKLFNVRELYNIVKNEEN